MLPCFHVPSSTRRGWRHTTGSGSGGEDKNLERAFLRFCIFCNPLKFHKTAKRIFGNPWTKQVEIWKCLAKKLGGQPTRPGDRPPFATLCDAMRKSPPFVRQATNLGLAGPTPPTRGFVLRSSASGEGSGVWRIGPRSARPRRQNGFARKWRRNDLKRLNPGPEMVWARKPRTHNIWYTGARLTVRDSG